MVIMIIITGRLENTESIPPPNPDAVSENPPNRRVPPSTCTKLYTTPMTTINKSKAKNVPQTPEKLEIAPSILCAVSSQEVV